MNFSFESILFVVVLLLLSGISNWLQKRRQSNGEETPGRAPEADGLPAPPTIRRGVPTSRPNPPTAPAPSSRSWEEELRRLLEGEPPVITAPPPAPPTPPPPTPTGRPVTQARPVVVVTPVPPRPTPVPAPRPPQLPVVVSAELEGGAPAVLARMEQSEAAMSRAGQLHADVARRLRRVDEMTARHEVRTVGDRVAVRSAEARAARVLLQNPRTARQAIVASVLLGAPKAFESGSPPLI